MSEMIARIQLVPQSGYIKKTATKAALTRELVVESSTLPTTYHCRRFTVLENISHQIKDVFVEPSLVLKLCDGNPQWDGISKEIALQKGPFKDFVLSHVSSRRINLSGMKMVASLQPRARYTGEQAFKELMPNLAEYPVSVIEDVMKLYTFTIKMHLEATRSGIQLADAGLHNFAFLVPSAMTVLSADCNLASISFGSIGRTASRSLHHHVARALTTQCVKL